MGLAETERRKKGKINGAIYDIPHIKMTLGEIFEGVD
jgi:hypothetical protein